MTRTRIKQVGPYLAAGAVLLAMLGFVSAAGVVLFIQERTDEQLCLSNVQNRAAIRSTWNAARELLLTTSDDKESVNLFFDSVLEPIPPLACVDNKPVPAG